MAVLRTIKSVPNFIFSLQTHLACVSQPKTFVASEVMAWLSLSVFV